jgi:hypothetical protein
MFQYSVQHNTFFISEHLHVPVSTDRHQGISTLFKNNVKYNMLNRYVLRFYFVLKYCTDGLMMVRTAQ